MKLPDNVEKSATKRTVAGKPMYVVYDGKGGVWIACNRSTKGKPNWRAYNQANPALSSSARSLTELATELVAADLIL